MNLTRAHVDSRVHSVLVPVSNAFSDLPISVDISEIDKTQPSEAEATQLPSVVKCSDLSVESQC